MSLRGFMCLFINVPYVFKSEIIRQKFTSILPISQPLPVNNTWSLLFKTYHSNVIILVENSFHLTFNR